MKRTLYLLPLLLCLALLVQAQSQINGTVQVHPGGNMGVYGNLNFNSGYVITPRTAPGNNVYATAGATHTGASDVSHVNGYVEEAGHATFTFPIGNGTSYRSAGIASANTATNYRAAYFSGNPGAATLPAGAPFATTSRATGVGDVSTVEYWDIDGSASASITLTWNAASNVNTLAGGSTSRLVIVGWNGSQWVNLGQAGGVSGTLVGNGSVTATNVTPNTYTAYTFGSVACQLAATATPAASTICAGGTISLSASTTGAVGTLSYNWSGPNNYSATGNPATISNATVSASGTYTVVVTDAGTGCNATAVTGGSGVTVNPKPVISSVTGSNPAICGTATGSLTLNGLSPSTNYQISYSANGGAPTSVTVTSSSSGQATLSGLASGTYTNITATSMGCTSDPSGPVTLSDPAPTPLSSANVTPFSPTSCTSTDGRIEIIGLAPNTSTTLSYLKNGVAGSSVVTTDNSGKAILANLGAGDYSNLSYAQGSCISSPYTATLSVAASGCSRISLRVYLQGGLFSNGGAIGANGLPLMRDNLRSGGYLPLNDPYRTAPYSTVFSHVNNAESQTIPASMATTTGDKAIVDWVFIELRNKTNPTQVSYTRSALLLRDGSVLDSDGQSGINFTGIPTDDYYVAVRHRNHMGIMTAQAITVPSSTTVDFNTMTDAQIWNAANYDALERSTTTAASVSVRALWAGNAVPNGKVKYNGSGTDLPGILSNVVSYPGNAGAYNYSTAYGYLIGDVNLDGRSLYIGSGNDGAFILSNVVNYPQNGAKTYNYDLLLQQLP